MEIFFQKKRGWRSPTTFSGQFVLEINLVIGNKSTQKGGGGGGGSDPLGSASQFKLEPPPPKKKFSTSLQQTPSP